MDRADDRGISSRYEELIELIAKVSDGFSSDSLKHLGEFPMQYGVRRLIVIGYFVEVLSQF